MFEFFRGWRRKAGVVTLTVACVLAVGMVRSLSKVECILFPIGNCFAGFVSIDARLGLGFEAAKPGNHQTNYPVWQTRDCIALEQLIDEGEPEWHWQYLGCHAVSEDDNSILLMFVPYWSIIVPVTLLSAYLLLRKQQPEKPPSEHSP